MTESLFEKFKNTPPEQVMKVGEVALVKPKASKRVDTEEFEFTFETTTVTDPEWRGIYEQHYYKPKKIRFHGSEVTVMCKPTELEHELPAIKLAIIATNKKYQAMRDQLLADIAVHKSAVKESAFNRALEESDVQEMFLKLKV